ncbi:hypothetical protein SLA2020_333840 [Shorea laevis]
MKNLVPWTTIWIVISWYGSNIGVLLLNKYLLSNYGFKYPIFLTMCHMLACSLLSYAAIAWAKVVPMQSIGHRIQETVLQDHRTQSVLLLLGCPRKRVASVPPGVVQPGDRGHHAVLHRDLRVRD